MLLFFSCNTDKMKSSKNVELETDLQKFSYSLGTSAGKYYAQNGLDSIDVAAFTAGLQDALTGKELKITEQEADKIIRDFMQAASDKKNAALKKEGEEFLAENAKKDSVEVLPDGLQYKVIKMGDGPKPTVNDKVKVHYEGRLIDGTIFDSSYRRGEPVTFPVTGVIKGWTEILQMMPVGSIWEVYVPYNLAYGERGAGQTIPPYATLIFKIELLDIEKPKQ